MSLVELLGAPLVESALLVGIHTWLGLHVLRRGVIFVDLALAQVAALGGLIGLLAGIEPGSTAAIAFTLIFALLGAALLSALRPGRNSPIPQEALIGLVYALATALALMAMAIVPEGAVHVTESLSGSLLWVNWNTVMTGVWVYGGVGLVHFLARKQLIQVSEDANAAAAAGLKIGWWDLLFYGTFAIVVTHSVATAGVLLVFVFLVAPATLAMMFTQGIRNQLLFGWAVGLVVCISGLGLSAKLDLPGGPTVVGVYAVVLSLVGVVVWLRRANSTIELMRRAGGLLLVIGIGVTSLVLLANHSHDHEEKHHLDTSHSADSAHGLLLEAVFAADLPEEKQAACSAATALNIKQALAETTETLSRIALARCLAPHDAHTARHALDRIANDPHAPPFLRQEAAQDF